MHRILSLVTTAIVILAPATAHAAQPRLVLPRSWFEVVEPFRYDEARRFERGWNRGAGVSVVGGAVRSPVDGWVRFSGDVAGEAVVTIESRVGGHAVVVTLTGMDRRSMAEGDVVRRGDVVGAGRDAHVGMYDPSRRSRYFPVVADGSVIAGAPAGGDQSPLADAVAARLLDAIRGDVDAVGAASSRRLVPEPRLRLVPSRSRAATQIAPVAQIVAAQRQPVRSGLASPTPVAPVGPRAADIRRLVRLGSLMQTQTAPVDSSRPARSGSRARSRGSRRVGSSAETRTGTTMGPGSRRLWPGEVGPARPRLQTTVEVDATGSGRSGGDPAAVTPVSPGERMDPVGVATRLPDQPARGRRVEQDASATGATSATWTIPLAMVALVAVVLLALRKRRRSEVEPSVPMVCPLPPILPSMHPRPDRLVRTDGHSIVGGTPLAWADHEAGTSTHEPELLRHHADLLPERTAPPRPCVHDDRGGRDHAFPAAHGP